MQKMAIMCGTLSRGGAERITIYLSKIIKSNNINIDIITVDIGKNEYKVPEGVTRICLSKNVLNDNAAFNTLQRVIKLFYEIVTLRKRIKKSNYDAVVIMGVTNCIISGVACLGLKTKVIVSERNSPMNFDGKRITKILARFFMKYADGFVFQTSEAKRFYDKKLNGKGIIIPNPLFIEDLPSPYKGVREKQIVSAGRLVEQKNFSMLIQAFSLIYDRFPEYELIIYGEGSLRKKLELQISNLGEVKNSIKLPGNITDLHRKIRKASLFVLPSNFEGMPNVLIEAMALGMPCISTDCACGGPREIINNGKNGILVDVGNVEMLAKAMGNLLQNREQAEHIALNALNIRNVLNADIIGEKWIKYIASVAVNMH